MFKTIIASSILVALSAQVSASQPTHTTNDDLVNVQNRCIIQFINTTTSGQVKGLANAMANKGKSKVRHLYSNSIKGFAVNMPCHAAASAFGDDLNIKSMSPDGIASISAKPGSGGGNSGQELPWSVTRVGGPVNANGATAWIIDSGIDLDHPDLNVDESRGFSSIKSGKDYSMDDQNGHGTHVAGTIAAIDNAIGVVGVAAGTNVVPVRVLGRSGSGSWSGIIAGIDHVSANASNGDCVNMSLGGGVNSDVDDAVVAAAQNSGAFFVLAAGNEGDHANEHSPARANGNNVFTISATDINDNMPSWSNYGNPPIDYAAPGVNILSLYKGGGTTTMSGTSMASPAACAVLMMSNGNPSTDGNAGNDPDGNPDPIIVL